MKSIDLTPLYSSSIGFDRLGGLIDAALRGNQSSSGYPPYDIVAHDENEYSITLAVAGFGLEELDIQVENGVLTIAGKKENESQKGEYLYRSIANRAFERKFNLADYVEVKGADLSNGLLTISLQRQVPEAMKPRKIDINKAGSTHNVLEHKPSGKEEKKQAA